MLSSFSLKIIAVVSMLIDHIGVVFFPDVMILRIIGRFAFPIFCFLLVEGYFHTHDLKKYLIRLGSFAVLSEVPFDLAFNGSLCDMGSQNVFLTLFLGMLMLAVFHRYGCKEIWVQVLVAVVFMGAAEAVHMDYGATGILMIYCFYVTRGRLLCQAILVSAVNLLSGYIQAFASLAMCPIACYNGQRGIRLKYLFYIFYPGHLIVLYLVRLLISG